MIRPVNESDAASITAIYNYYVEHTLITFEENKISVDDMKLRIVKTSPPYPWLVYEHEGVIVAYAYAGLWKSRSAYRYTLENTIYGAVDMPQRLGIGTKLCEKLLEDLDTQMVRSVMAVIALPNNASIGLHEKLGFEKVAHFKEVGYKFDKWIDVGYWQKIL